MGRLYWKFFIAILLAQVAATIGVAGAFWLRDQAREKAGTPALDTSPPAEIQVEAAAATLSHGGTAAARELLHALRQHSVRIVDENGQELLNRPVATDLLVQAEQRLKRGGDHTVVRSVTAADSHRYLIFAPWDRRHGPNPPPAPRQVADGGPGHDGPGPKPPPDAMMVPFAPLAAGLVASLLVAALLAWYFARPIRALRSAFEAAAEGDLAPRFAHTTGQGGDELNDLGRDFDRMSAQLRALMDGQRRLLHDVSHELRSPLARLQAAIGLAHQQPDKLDASLDRIERESVRMDKLVGELLTLARLEAAAPFPMNEEIDIQELVEEIVGDARFEAGQKNRSLTLSDKTEARVRGAPDLLWRAIENVVRNAIKHSFDGGVVEVSLASDAAHVRVQVQDRGPGVPAGDTAAIFQPFYRTHAASTDGHGLGLAIAERVVHAHGGTITAVNRDGGGLTVLITLPRLA